MRLDTEVWIRCESKGRPVHTMQKATTIRGAVMEIAQWLSDSYMGSHIEIKIARNEADLHRKAKTSELNSMMGELESLLGGTPEEKQEYLDNHPHRETMSRETLCADEECPRVRAEEDHVQGSPGCIWERESDAEQRYHDAQQTAQVKL